MSFAFSFAICGRYNKILVCVRSLNLSFAAVFSGFGWVVRS